MAHGIIRRLRWAFRRAVREVAPDSVMVVKPSTSDDVLVEIETLDCAVTEQV